MERETEEALAHLERTVEELSAVVARQAGEIARLERRLGLLIAREAEREADAGAGVPHADRPPPHY